MTAPASARIEVVMFAMPGVGSGPTSSTSTPIEVMPAARACSSMYPESRVSLPITTRCRWLPLRMRKASARPSCMATSAVIGQTLAVPRTPSVPNSLVFAWASGSLINLTLRDPPTARHATPGQLHARDRHRPPQGKEGARRWVSLLERRQVTGVLAQLLGPEEPPDDFSAPGLWELVHHLDAAGGGDGAQLVSDVLHQLGLQLGSGVAA